MGTKSKAQTRSPDPRTYGWQTGVKHGRIKMIRRVLYRLPAVREAIKDGTPIYVPEGEKDVHAIEEAGGVGTTNPGGAGKWSRAYTEALKGASEVIIIADRDPAGAKHAGK